MTDKLICPFCNADSILDEPLCGYPDGPRMLMCYNTDCPTTGRWLPEQTWRQIIALQKKLERLTIAAQRCLNKFAHERIHAELKAALKEIEDIKE